MITETSTFVDEHELRDFHSFLHCLDTGTVVAQQRARQPHPRTALVGSQPSSAQFALWVHVSAAHRRLKHSVGKIYLRHHPHVHLGLLELDFAGSRRRPQPKDLVHEALLNPFLREELEDLLEEPRPPPPRRLTATSPPPPPQPCPARRCLKNSSKPQPVLRGRANPPTSTTRTDTRTSGKLMTRQPRQHTTHTPRGHQATHKHSPRQENVRRSIFCTGSGLLLASPASPHQGRTDWLLSPRPTTRGSAMAGLLLLCSICGKTPETDKKEK